MSRRRRATRRISSSLSAASTKRTSAPASRYRRARSMALSMPSTARASVRAMITKSGDCRAATAAWTFASISASGNDLLPFHVTALLGCHLILDVDAGDPRPLVLLHGADDVERVAVAGVGVGDDRQFAGGDDPGGVVDHLAHREQADVGPPEQRRRRPEPGHVHRREPRLFHQAGAETVEDAGSQYRVRACQQLPQPPRAAGLRPEEPSHPSPPPRHASADATPTPGSLRSGSARHRRHSKVPAVANQL